MGTYVQKVIEDPIIGNPVISVVIPAYNQADLLKTCVMSVLACDYPKSDFQIIIVDDASTDHTKDVMEKLKASSLNQITCVYHKENRKASASRNTGIMAARPDVKVLAFIDQDCTVPTNWLRVIATTFKGDADLAFIGGQVLSNAENLIQEWAKYMSHRICDYEDYQTRVIGTNMAFRQYIFWDNFFDEDVAYGTDETEFVFRLVIKDFKYKVAKDLVVYHYHRDNLWDLILQRWAYGRGEAFFYLKYGFSIYHPVNKYIFKMNVVIILFIVLVLLGHVWWSVPFGILALRYLIKYAQMRYISFLNDSDLPVWKVAVFIGINLLVDNVVLASKLRIGDLI